MQKTATVAVINSDKKVLILLRGSTAPWMPLRYCLPGGHVEPNEDATYAASRELSEETGIVYPVDEFKTINVVYSSTYTKKVWIAHVNSSRVILNWEHDDYRWVSGIESSVLQLVPGLRHTIKTLQDCDLVI